MGVDETWTAPRQRTVNELLAARVASDPDSPFLTIDGVAFTAREMDAASNRFANRLLELGVQHGDRVATLVENTPEAVFAFYGTLKVGAVNVPVNTAHKGVFLEHHLRDADPTVLVVADELADRVPAGLVPHVLRIGHDAVLATSDAAPDVDVRPTDLAALIYTGGTTGPSKGCALSHNYVVNMTEKNVITWGRRPDDVVWTPLPLFHFNAVGVTLVQTLIVGGSAVIDRRFSVSRFWQQISAAGATIASLLGSPAVLIARSEHEPAGPTTLRLVTAAPMPPEIDEIFRRRWGVATFSYAYGTTEVSLVSWLPPGVPPRVASAGVVNDEDFDVRIFDDDDNELPRGTQGEIVVRPRKPNVMFDGYWRRPDATARDGRNWWWHTGDIGRIDEDGYLYFVDRKADYIRRRGENISTWEVEQAFHQHELVADVAVCGIPSPLGEEDLKVTIVLQPGAVVSEEEICRWSMDQLPYFAVPRYVEFRTDLPRSDTGRITKAPLRAEGVTATTWDREAAGIAVTR